MHVKTKSKNNVQISFSQILLTRMIIGISRALKHGFSLNEYNTIFKLNLKHLQ